VGDEMKVRVTMKDPDALDEALYEAVLKLQKPEDVSKEEWQLICEHRQAAAHDAIRPFMKYSEYITVEFDTDAHTATVIKTN
jgi:hypothetical protein